MAEHDIRRWAALAATVCSLLLAGLLTHALREAVEPGHDHSASGAVAFCFAFATLLAPLALSLAGRREPRREALQTVAPTGALLIPSLPLRSRASPAWLQRFRN